MNWQEYQEAVAVFYEQTDGFGNVRRNVMIPDKITGHARQIDVLIELEAKGHSVKLVVDAKFHSSPIDVKEVESVLALAEAVGASKAVIVAANGWTAPAAIKASHTGCDMRILPLEEALDLIVTDKWEMCPCCLRDCIVLDQDGALITEDGLLFWWLAGQCRECKHSFAWCQECGSYLEIPQGQSAECNCRHLWMNSQNGINLTLCEERGYLRAEGRE
ncbi:MAG: restriction endonuclease [Formivibrio sp.]|nr:restriction endonuclease [Formivibrio sp.]